MLLALVRAGVTRDAAYRVVQAAARTASSEARPLRAVLENDAALADMLGPDRVGKVLDEAFDLGRALRNVRRTIEALEEVEA